MKQKIKIIIVDDNPTFLEGLRFFLENKEKYQIIGQANDGKNFLNLKDINSADVILMDLTMPGINGLKAAKIILNDYPELKMIAITMYQEKAYLVRLIESGFKGCVFKSKLYEKLEEAMQSVLNGNLYFPKNLKLSDDSDPDPYF